MLLNRHVVAYCHKNYLTGCKGPFNCFFLNSHITTVNHKESVQRNGVSFYRNMNCDSV